MFYKKILLILSISIILLSLISCNNNNIEQGKSKVISDNNVKEESIDEKFTENFFLF